MSYTDQRLKGLIDNIKKEFEKRDTMSKKLLLIQSLEHKLHEIQLPKEYIKLEDCPF